MRSRELRAGQEADRRHLPQLHRAFTANRSVTEGIIKHQLARRLAFLGVATGVLSLSVASARPLVIEESQYLERPQTAWSYFGESVAIDGDWALATALYSADRTYDYPYQQMALLYRRSGGTWNFERVLVDDTTDRVSWNYPHVSMKNGLAAVSTTPLRVFQRNGGTWTALPDPFSARPSDASWANGLTRIDANTVASVAGRCRHGAVTATRAGGAWGAPRLVAGNPRLCTLSNYSASMDIDGDRLAFTSPQEDEVHPPGETRLYQRAAPGEPWRLDAILPVADYGTGLALRDDELFLGSWNPLGNDIYRRGAGGWTLAGHLPTLRGFSPDYQPAYHFGKGGEFVLVATPFSDDDPGGVAVYRREAGGAYRHVAQLISSIGDSLGPVVEISGRSVVVGGWTRDHPDQGRLYFFDLPQDLSAATVLQDDFEDGDAAGWKVESGTFQVARRGATRVLRRTDSQGPGVAVLATRSTRHQSIQADFLSTAPGANRAFGLATRYLDARNHYALLLQGAGRAELRRVQAATSTVLASRPLAVVAGRRYHLRLESVGNHHRVYVNGERLLDAVDGALDRGRAAVLVADAGADIDNVLVTPGRRTSLFVADIPAGGCQEFLGTRGLRESGTPQWDCSDHEAGHLRQASLDGLARAVVGPETGDQAVESRLRLEDFAISDSEEWLGVMTRYTDESNYYYFVLRNSKVMSLRKLVNGRATELGRAAFTLGTGNWLTFKLEAVGNRLRAYVNGQLVIQAEDSTHPTGASGIATYKAAALFDYLRVTQP